MVTDLGVFSAIDSLQQITRYRPDPVPREVVVRIIKAATKAPSGGNIQPWDFVVIDDPALIRQVGGLYRTAWEEAVGSTPSPNETPVYRAARYLAEHMAEVPVLILVCANHTRGTVPLAPGEALIRGRYASSIFLAVQNLFLAARALGLGTRLTTAHLRREAEIKALLAIPDYVETVALTPLGYPRGRFGPPLRRAASETTSFNRFGNRGGAGG